MSRMRAGVLAPECCPQLRRTFGARSPCTSPGKRHANKLAALPVDHISGAFQLEQFRRARAGDARQPHCTYDVVGLGQAMCDFSGKVAQEYLGSRQLQLGGRRCALVDSLACVCTGYVRVASLRSWCLRFCTSGCIHCGKLEHRISISDTHMHRRLGRWSWGLQGRVEMLQGSLHACLLDVYSLSLQLSNCA